jgi:hypothetical protein
MPSNVVCQVHQLSTTLTFAEMDAPVDGLPVSAATFRPSWGNEPDTRRRPQAKAWQQAGRLVEEVELGAVGALLRAEPGVEAGRCRPRRRVPASPRLPRICRVEPTERNPHRLGDPVHATPGRSRAGLLRRASPQPSAAPPG